VHCLKNLNRSDQGCSSFSLLHTEVFEYLSLRLGMSSEVAANCDLGVDGCSQTLDGCSHTLQGQDMAFFPLDCGIGIFLPQLRIGLILLILEELQGLANVQLGRSNGSLAGT